MAHSHAKANVIMYPRLHAKSCQTSCKVVGQAVKPLQCMILLDRPLRQDNESPHVGIYGPLSPFFLRIYNKTRVHSPSFTPVLLSRSLILPTFGPILKLI